ncbi:MAG: cobalt-precorrin-6A reductase, partial [Pseudomonadota bacterium]
DVIMSLAGRTQNPLPQIVPARFGGFGGPAGLADFITREHIDAVVDATHPFAARMSANAVAACVSTNTPLLSLRRPAWRQKPGDNWQCVTNYSQARTALGHDQKTVFLSIGRLNLSAFADLPQHSYIARTIDPPGDITLPPNIKFAHDRGPFDLPSELSFFKENAIDIIVSKNSGGTATYAKIEAARLLQRPVIMIDRPHKPSGNVFDKPEDVLNCLMAHANTHHAMTFSDRGV